MAKQNQAKTDYQLAVEGGYTGTEAEFLANQLADEATGKPDKGETNPDTTEKKDETKDISQESSSTEDLTLQSQQAKTKEPLKSFIVIKAFKDAKQFVPNGDTAISYSVGEIFEHFDENRIASLLSRKLIKEA